MTEYSAAKQAYIGMAAKYSLPEFDELIIRFGIKNLKWPEHLILYNMIEGINARIQVSSYILESILTGVGSEGRCEHRMLSKEQRSEVKAMWAKLQTIKWSVYVNSRSLNENQIAEQINKYYKFHIDEFMPFAKKYSCHFEAKWKGFDTADCPKNEFYN